MLSTTRGYQGGYKLAKSPSECTVGAILQTTEGSLAPVSCLEHTPNPVSYTHLDVYKRQDVMAEL